jgi:N-methylhydantoinase B
MIVKDDELVLDFTGSDPQLQSALNVPTGGRERHVLPTLGLIHVLYSLDPTIMLNTGIFRNCRCILPEGTVVNPQAPAAVGMRSLTCNVLQQVVFGAFSLAAPNRLPASPAGGQTIMNVRTSHGDGTPIMASIGPVGGGAGGNSGTDGSEGSGANTAFLRNTPVEVTEAEVPIRMRRYGVVRDSGGPGKYRGGSGAMMEFQVFAPNSIVTARNRDRSRFASWGVLGGMAGGNSRFTLNPGTEREVRLDNTDVLNVQPGDIVRIEGPGGGGYGSPFERDPERVLRDVVRGYVSERAARELYGVVVTGSQLDLAATTALRQGVVERGDQHFQYDANRLAYEAVMTKERYAALTHILAAVPVNWRFYLKHEILSRLLKNDDKVRTGGAAVYDAYEAVRTRSTTLPAIEPA